MTTVALSLAELNLAQIDAPVLRPLGQDTARRAVSLACRAFLRGNYREEFVNDGDGGYRELSFDGAADLLDEIASLSDANYAIAHRVLDSLIAEAADYKPARNYRDARTLRAARRTR